jgi:hypothetical protein
MRRGVADDARTVAGGASAAGRRLKPDPVRLTDEDTLVAPSIDTPATGQAPGDVTTQVAATPVAAPHAGDATTQIAAATPDDATTQIAATAATTVPAPATDEATTQVAAAAAVAAPAWVAGRAATALRARTRPPRAPTDEQATTVRPSVGTVPTEAAFPSGVPPTTATPESTLDAEVGGSVSSPDGAASPAESGTRLDTASPAESDTRLDAARPTESDTHLDTAVPAESDVRPGTDSVAEIGTTAAAGTVARPGRQASRERAGRAPRDGVVVPLRVPWRTRLRATAGLVAMVVVLGASAAAIVVAVVIAAVQALGSV